MLSLLRVCARSGVRRTVEQGSLDDFRRMRQAAPTLSSGDRMRAVAFAAALSLFAMPSFARSKSTAPKAPKAGQYCAKSAIGTTAQDKTGATLTCAADKKGKGRWTK
jgi:hypothetical protein